ncbi:MULTISPECIES: hypothetical protein [unclassified Rhizobium]|uniref:hypothetical protein n=1 Tax=unclassified Rhizobium TaxID=2613769 RepID=UPI0007EBCDF9|nr:MULTISPECIES: hypothetical protein [unclassified Rhizobium]ANK92757.1 hypothetical protein AMK01_CH03334 [Rhizobium sp. N6212]ANK98802.1 hypothetical protein AMK00_CH03338 [Rhizobium sp. N621]
MSSKGYEIGGLPVWYHPLRVDMWAALGDVQRANLRERVRIEQSAAGADASESAVDKIYRQAEYADRRKRGDYSLQSFLRQIRRHHISNGGLIFDMASLGPHLEATWADGITLKNVFPWRTAIYVHVGATLEYDRENPASLIEGFYINHSDSPVRGWLLTFVTNHPDWERRAHHMPSHTRKSYIAFAIPENADIAQIDYAKLKIRGDKDLAKQASLWHLARLATNAMLYLSRARPDVQGTMSMFRTETSDTNRTEIYECGCDEVDWDIDWSNATLMPGRWIVDDPGGDRTPMVTRWVPPRLVLPQEREKFLQDGGKVLEFKARKR